MRATPTYFVTHQTQQISKAGVVNDSVGGWERPPCVLVPPAVLCPPGASPPCGGVPPPCGGRLLPPPLRWVLALCAGAPLWCCVPPSVLFGCALSRL